MHGTKHPSLRNRLLALVPANEFQNIAEVLHPVDLPKGTVITRANEKIDCVYFLCSGIGSVVTTAKDGQRAEAGMVGREGFCPTSAGVGGTISIHEVLMQVPGQAYTMQLGAMTDILPTNPVFSNLLARYIQSFAAQISFTALCNANYQVDQRLARWLLMCHDRLDGDEIMITHDFVSLMLAVRRPSVTNAFHILEGLKLVFAERGRVTIRDRKGLEDFAGAAYGDPEEEYRRLIGEI
ncbi:CRP-like cAMP-binding protein [Neorhizobium huautlense]|uniref:CRP-like cAMP-binding protein n=1 Tax=Neorhizobium huautlense TaxID=67774 RepID=A0ABT9Q1E3_9HYPH|nr:Crp/Fnr family transcriptional regulator [Neorhizobium huautlense]MDP9840502.1 CRP-like cAMP-binding protein [Neorhizobium huautlense]